VANEQVLTTFELYKIILWQKLLLKDPDQFLLIALFHFLKIILIMHHLLDLKQAGKNCGLSI
jgi:hypothetical protein